MAILTQESVCRRHPLSYLCSTKVIWGLISCLLLFVVDAVSAEDSSQYQPWWNFVVAIDAQFRDGHTETGKGIIIGRFDGGNRTDEPKSLFVVTANHLVQLLNGQQVATSITVRLPWSATQPRVARLTGLRNPDLDVALLSVPLQYSDRFDEEALRLLVVSCPAALKASGKVRVGDVTAGISSFGGKSTGSVIGEDGHGKLLVDGLSLIKGQSGSPLIDADGAAVAILTSSEGSQGVVVGVSIQRLVTMFPDLSCLDERLQSMSGKDCEAHRFDDIEGIGCRVSYAACVMQKCSKDCDAAGDSIAAQRCADCQSNCRPATCRELLTKPGHEPWRLEWYFVPTCHCVDVGLTSFGAEQVTPDQVPFRCTEPALIGRVQPGLRADLAACISQLGNMFPATRSDFETYVQQQPGSVWKLYRERMAQALDTEAGKDSATPLEKQAVDTLFTKNIGPPICHRFPSSFPKKAGENLHHWLEEDVPGVTEVRGGFSWCEFSISINDEKATLPFLQLGDKWIFFPKP
jgi:trypsin-like peptidase